MIGIGRTLVLSGKLHFSIKRLDLYLRCTNYMNLRCSTGEVSGNPIQYFCLENPMDRGAWQAAVHGVSKSLDMTKWLHFHFSLSCIGEGNGNPLQCSCLENLRDGGAWWAAFYGVVQSQTWLKWLSSSNVIRQKGKNMINIFCLAMNEWTRWLKNFLLL